MKTKRKKGDRKKSILIILLAFGPAILFLLFTLTRVTNNYQKLPTYAEMPQYEFIGSDKEKLSNQTQEGKITAFTTIQTSCPRECAIDIFKLNLSFYQDLRKDQKEFKNIEIVSIVTDEEGNPVDDIDEIIFTLQDMMEEYDPSIWKIVTGDPKQVYNVENDKGVNLYEYKDDEAYHGKPYLGTLLLVDKHNKLRYIGLGDQEGYIRDFKQHVALLRQEYKKEKRDESN